jgi:probable rRNA maturation factor
MANAIDIVNEAGDWTRVPGHRAVLRKAARAALAHEKARKDGAIAILLTDNEGICRLNQQFRGLNKPTNVLSFPAMPNQSMALARELPFLGDLALGYEICRSEAEAEGKSLVDHLSHLVVHGVLHLMGYDHEADAEAEVMEARERSILSRLGIADPYAGAEGGATE